MTRWGGDATTNRLKTGPGGAARKELEGRVAVVFVDVAAELLGPRVPGAEVRVYRPPGFATTGK